MKTEKIIDNHPIQRTLLNALFFIVALCLAVTSSQPAYSHGQGNKKSVEAMAFIAQLKNQAENLTIQLSQSIKEYHSASTDGQNLLFANLQNLVKERKLLMQDLIKNQTATALSIALPDRLQQNLPDELKTAIEHIDEIEGELEVLHVDHEDPAQSHYEYYLKTPSEKRISLHFVVQPQGILSGASIRAKGLLLESFEGNDQGAETSGMMAIGDENNNLVLLAAGGTGTSTTSTSTAIAPYTFGEQRTAVLLVNFVSLPQEPWTIEQARTAVFSDASNFFLENSYGQTWLAGDVFGWLTIDVDPSGCPTTNIAIAANQAAGAQGINLSNYNRVVYAFPNIGCSWSGQASVGGNPARAWLDGTLLDIGILSHELGHGFGLYHSHALECFSDVVGSNCASAEYGDALDKMGASSAGHFNAYQKERLGWLNYGASPPIVTVESTGVYQLEPLSTQTQGPKALRVLRDVDPATGERRWYYLEFRQPFGFDGFLSSSPYGASVLNGLVFHLGTENTPNSSSLLDMTPSSHQYDWYDMALAYGIDYNDSVPGITVTLDSYNTTGATVSVSLNQSSCVHANPQLTISPSASGWVAPGTPVNYTITVTNADSSACSNATFDLAAQIPNGWSSAFDQAAITLAPEGSSSVDLTVISSSDAADGFYDVTAAATNRNSAGYMGSATATYSVSTSGSDSPPVAVDDDASTTSGTPVTITVMANDYDLDDDPITVTRAGQGSKGTTVINPDGSVTYTPGKSFKNSDSFTYDIFDGITTATATVFINSQGGTNGGNGGKGSGKR